MAKKILVGIIVLFCLLSALVYAESITLPTIRTQEVNLARGENLSLILAPGSPISIRLYQGTVVNFNIDGITHTAIFDKLDDTSTIRVSDDNGQTFNEIKIKLGDQLKFNLTTGSWFYMLTFNIKKETTNDAERTAVFELGIPYIQKYNVDVPVQKSNESEKNNISTNISANLNETPKSTNNYLKYLIGIIIVLVLIIIILGPRKKKNKHEENQEEEDKSEKKSKKIEKKGYYKKPKKKKFDEEDVYVVKPSDEE